MSLKSVGLGGAITIRYTCSGCVMKYAQLEASSKYDGVGSMTEIGMDVQVAFIVAGCTHTTLKHLRVRWELMQFALRYFNIPLRRCIQW